MTEEPKPGRVSAGHLYQSFVIRNYPRAGFTFANKNNKNTNMHDRTKKLHDVMSEHKLNTKHVAKLVNRSYNTVRIWRCKSENKVIPASMLRLLELELSARDKAGQ